MNTNNLYFSVVVATYNRPSLLLRCIRSILTTKEPNLEIIVIDDCSSVGYDTFLKEYPWVVYEKNISNFGPGITRNRGIELAKNNWIVILDDDDELLPDAFNKIRNGLTFLNNPDVFPVIQFAQSNFSVIKKVFNDGCFVELNVSDYMEDRIKGDAVPVINKHLFVAHKFVYPGIKIGGETILWLNILRSYSLPIFLSVVCRVNNDAPSRLTDISNQIINCGQYAEYQNILLTEFFDLYLKYPKAKLKRQLGYVIYKILNKQGQEAREYLNAKMKGVNVFLFMSVKFLSYLPLALVRLLFVSYRKFKAM